MATTTATLNGSAAGYGWGKTAKYGHFVMRISTGTILRDHLRTQREACRLAGIWACEDETAIRDSEDDQADEETGEVEDMGDDEREDYLAELAMNGWTDEEFATLDLEEQMQVSQMSSEIEDLADRQSEREVYG